MTKKKYEVVVYMKIEPEDTIIDKDRYEESGVLGIDEKIVKKYGQQ